MNQQNKKGNKMPKQKKAVKRQEKNIYFEVMLIIIIIPLFTFFSISIFNKHNSNFIMKKIALNQEDVKIITEKRLYYAGEKIDLFIKNDSKEFIYFEPCEYLNKFEKKINGEWIKLSSYEGAKAYDESGFKKEKDLVNCKINSPEGEEGTYRVVAQIYYECEKPGKDMCKDSNIFYSNEFEAGK